MVRARSCPAFLHPSAGYHYPVISLGFKKPSKESRLQSPLTLDVLLYDLCWFPICDPSWAHQLPSESPVFISETLLQISPWPRQAQQNQDLPPPLLLVSPAAAGEGVGSGLWVAWPRVWYFLLIICLHSWLLIVRLLDTCSAD